jgi:Ca2+-binding RTX toxin-like protein
MRRLSVMCGALLLSALTISAQQGLTLQVQLHYTGSGTVDETHKIFVALWDSAGFTGDSAPPVDVKAATSKNGSVTFTDVKKVPAYVSAAYDPTGKWDAQSPPPSGSSLGMYSKAPPKPEPINITPGKAAKVTITFDDTQKVQ